MPTLTDLPSELLLLVFALSHDIHDAVSFCRVNRRLHAIWLENADHISKAVLEESIPAYDDAVDLAKVEARYTTPTNELSSDPTTTELAPHLWLRLLVKYAELVSLADILLTRMERESPRIMEWPPFEILSFPPSYYMIRKIVLSYDHPELRPALNATLEQSSADRIMTHFNLINILCEWAEFEEQLPHGIPKRREDWTYEDAFDDYALLPPWDFAFSVLCFAKILREDPDNPEHRKNPLITPQEFGYLR
ncbi:hypothetical protein M409DRAFT_26545 [Zasmidium cellare ATCC 36951]|uniref:F-box domain-containing protein n=1 Tax=Zasmidium cellare ATCC 36951 TaxID=1080233 RepID=A0A6A6CBQ5_ZASCE|nr:uncharacterized protein M409DRAFT_26545 [Zasmidium cellare ATCC 36951]KAF2163099.1 hypothetical protein M409DRAFT_26545 [Zasmidium cellare ATCC 36951]